MTVPKSTFSSRFKLRSLRKLRRHADRFKTLTENSDPSQCEVFFTGKSSYGPVGIAAGMSVESSASPDVGDALHALVLGVIEPKLQFAENWLQCGFDIEPGLKRPEVNSELFSIRDKSGSGTSITLLLPVQYWNLIPEMPMKGLSSEWEVVWSKYKGTVRLSQLSMQHNEVEGITQGSLVLIPESFEEHWSSSIDVMDLSVLLPGEYAAGTSSWSSAGRVESIPNDDVIQLEDNNDAPANLSTEEPTSLELKGVITHSIEVPASALVPSTGQQTLPTPKTTTHQECRLAVSNGKVYTGYIAPVASGFGMFVTGGRSL